MLDLPPPPAVLTPLVSAWLLSWWSGFLPQSKHMRIRQLATKNCLEV